MNRSRLFSSARLLSAVVLLASILSPAPVLACACGCGVFDVGTSAMLPTQTGGMAYLEFDGMDQNQNWSGARKASADANSDKKLSTGFFTGGLQYMVSRSWGYVVEVPYWDRYFLTTDDSGNSAGFTHAAVGDIRVKGVYSGFSSDMSSGLTFGIKLPTGDFTYPNFDRDSSIGTGSTDLLLGAYRMGRIGATDFNWFANAQWDEPILAAGGYRPGAEVDAVAGTYYDAGKIGAVKIAPSAEIVGSYRWRDSGILADSPDSGYRRLFLTPGVEFNTGAVRVYADVGFPVYQFVNGNQLVAAELFKLNVGYAF